MSTQEQTGKPMSEEELERQRQQEHGQSNDPERQRKEGGDEPIGPDTPEKLTNAGEM